MTSSLAGSGVAGSPAAAVDALDGQDYLEPPPALETSSAPPVKHPLFGQYEYDVAGDAPYPIWLLDPEGPWYKAILSAAQGSADILEAIHSTTGMPWWATIMAGTFLLRGAVLPISIYALRNASKAFDAQGDIRALMRSYNTAVARLGTDAPAMAKVGLTRSLMRGVRAALHKAGCYPWRTFATPFVHAPLLLLGGLGGRHLVLMGDESFETGGFAWFSDLTMADPTFMLPALAYVSSYAFMEYAYQTPGGGQKTAGAPAIMGGRLVSGLRNTFQLWLLLTIPFTYQLPAGLYLGWVAGTAWAGMWVTFIRTDAAHRLLTGRRAPRHVAAESDPFNVADIPDVLTVQVAKEDLPPIQRAMARYDAAAERVASAVVSALQAVGVGAAQRRSAADWDQQQFASEAERVAMQLRLKETGRPEQDVTATMGAVAATGERPRAAPAAAHLGDAAGTPDLPQLPKAAAPGGGSSSSKDGPAWYEGGSGGVGGGGDDDGDDGDGKGGKGGSGAAGGVTGGASSTSSPASSGGGGVSAAGASDKDWTAADKQYISALDSFFVASYGALGAGAGPVMHLLGVAATAPHMHPELHQRMASPAAQDGVSRAHMPLGKGDFPSGSYATRAARRAARNSAAAPDSPLHAAQFSGDTAARGDRPPAASPEQREDTKQGPVSNSAADLGAASLSGALHALRSAAAAVRAAVGTAADKAAAALKGNNAAPASKPSAPTRRPVTPEQKQMLAARVQALLAEAGAAEKNAAAAAAGGTPPSEGREAGDSASSSRKRAAEAEGADRAGELPMFKYPYTAPPAPFKGFGQNGSGWSSAANHIARSRVATDASLLQTITSVLLHGTPSTGTLPHGRPQSSSQAPPAASGAEPNPQTETVAKTQPADAAPTVQGPMAAAAAGTKQPFLHPGRVYREALLLTRHVLALEAPAAGAPSQTQVEQSAGEAEHVPAASSQDLMESLAPHVDVRALATPAAQRRALERLRVLRAVVRATAEQTGVEPPPVEEAALYARGMVESVSWTAKSASGGGALQSAGGNVATPVFVSSGSDTAPGAAAEREDTAVRHNMTVTLAAVDMAMSALQAARRKTAFAAATDAAAAAGGKSNADASPVAPSAAPSASPAPTPPRPSGGESTFVSRRRQRAQRSESQATSSSHQPEPAPRQAVVPAELEPVSEGDLRTLPHSDALRALYAPAADSDASGPQRGAFAAPPRVQRSAPWRSGGRAPLPQTVSRRGGAAEQRSASQATDEHGEPTIPSEGYVTAQLPQVHTGKAGLDASREEAWRNARRAAASASQAGADENWVEAWQRMVQQRAEDDAELSGPPHHEEFDEAEEDAEDMVEPPRSRRHTGVGVPPASASQLPAAARKYALPAHAPALLMPGVLLGERELAIADALSKQGLASRITSALLQGLERAYGGLHVKGGGRSSHGAEASGTGGGGAHSSGAGGSGDDGDGKGGKGGWWGSLWSAGAKDGSNATRTEPIVDEEDSAASDKVPAREVMDAECWGDSSDDEHVTERGGGPRRDAPRGNAGRTMIVITQDGHEVLDEGMEDHDEETASHSARAAEPEVDQWALLREELDAGSSTAAASASAGDSSSSSSHKERISELLSDHAPAAARSAARARTAQEERDAAAEARLRSAVNPLAALYGTGEYEQLDEVQDAWRGGLGGEGVKGGSAEVDISSALTDIALEGVDDEEEAQWGEHAHDDTPTGVQSEDLTALMGPGAAADADSARRHPHTKRVVSSLWRTVLPALRSGMGANLVMPVPSSVQRRLEAAEGRSGMKKADDWGSDEPEGDRTDLLKGILDDDAAPGASSGGEDDDSKS